MRDLQLFAQFHESARWDPGPDSFLNPVHDPGRKKRNGASLRNWLPDCSVLTELIPIADWILNITNGGWFRVPYWPQNGENPLSLRVLAIADAYDAMTNDRPYRLAYEQGKSRVRTPNGAGIQFDPCVVYFFLAFFS